jgi:hypothetical protein
LGVLATCAIVVLFYSGKDGRSAVGMTTTITATTNTTTYTTNLSEPPLEEELVVVEEGE